MPCPPPSRYAKRHANKRRCERQSSQSAARTSASAARQVSASAARLSGETRANETHEHNNINNNTIHLHEQDRNNNDNNDFNDNDNYNDNHNQQEQQEEEEDAHNPIRNFMPVQSPDVARAWASIAPSIPPSVPDKYLDEESLARLVADFENEVHNARVFGCAMCGEIQIENASSETLSVSTNDPGLGIAPRPAVDPPKRHEDESFNARHPTRGFIKRLIGKHGAGYNRIPVCEECECHVRHRRPQRIWQTAYDFGVLPDCLDGLTDVEKECIAAAHAYVFMIHIAASNGGCAKTLRGNTIAFPQRIFYNPKGYVERDASMSSASNGGSVVDPFAHLNVSFLFTGPKGMKTTVAGRIRRQFLMANLEKIDAANNYLRLSNPELFGHRRFPTGQTLSDCLDRFANDVIEKSFHEQERSKNATGDDNTDGATENVVVVGSAVMARTLDERMIEQDRFEEAEVLEGNAANNTNNNGDATTAATAGEGGDGIEIIMEGEIVADDSEALAIAARSSKETCLLEAKQGAEPINEFTKNRLNMEACFPHLFPNNGSFPTNALPSPKLQRHLVLYYDGRFQKDSRFLFHLNSQRVRFGAARNNAKVARAYVDEAQLKLSGPESGAFFNALAEGERKVKEKKTATMTDEEHAAMRFVRQAIVISYYRVAFTRADRSVGRWWVNSIVRARGVPAVFVTFSPSLVDSSLGMRLVVRFEGRGGEEEDPRTMEYGTRSNLVFASPGLSAFFFERVVNIFREKILGISDADIAKTKPYYEVKPGLFGPVLDYFQAVECQGRSLLHLHVLLWTATSPEKLSAMIKMGDLQRALDHVDRMVTGTMPEDFYKERLQLWVDRQPVCPVFLTEERPYSELPESEQKGMLYSVLGRNNLHLQHKPSCAKGLSNIRPEKRHCRLAFARVPAETTMLRHIDNVPSSDKQMTIADYHTLGAEEAAAKSVCSHHVRCGCGNVFDNAALPPMIVAEKRSGKKMRVTGTEDTERHLVMRTDTLFAETNLTLALCMRCNTNVGLISTRESGISTMEYLVGYATKADENSGIAARALQRRLALEEKRRGRRAAAAYAINTINNNGNDNGDDSADIDNADNGGGDGDNNNDNNTDSDNNDNAATADGGNTDNNRRQRGRRAAAPAPEANPYDPFAPTDDPNRNRPNTTMNIIANVGNSATETPATMASAALIGMTRFAMSATIAAVPCIALFNYLVPPSELKKIFLTQFPRSDPDRVIAPIEQEQTELNYNFSAVRLLNYEGPNQDDGVVGENADNLRDADINQGEDEHDDFEGEDMIERKTGTIGTRSFAENYMHRPRSMEGVALLDFAMMYGERAASREEKEHSEALEQQQQQGPNDGDGDSDGDGDDAAASKKMYIAPHSRRHDVRIVKHNRVRMPGFVGPRPPSLPSDSVDTRDARERRLKFTIFWYLLLVPWRRETLDFSRVTFESFMCMLNTWVQSGDDTLAAKALFCQRCTYGMSSSNANRSRFIKYRNSCSDNLAEARAAARGDDAENDNNGGDPEATEMTETREEADQREADDFATKIATFADSDDTNQTLGESLLACLPPIPFNERFTSEHYAAQTFQKGRVFVEGQLPREDLKKETGAIAGFTHEDLKDIFVRNVNRPAAGGQNADADDEHGRHSIEHFEHPRTMGVAWDNLSNQQKIVAENVFKAVKGGFPVTFWLDGAAGTGKTHNVRFMIDHVRRWLGYDSVICCAFQGIAASNIETGAYTINSLFDIPIYNTNKPDYKRHEVMKRVGACRLLVIDEMSMVSESMFELINRRMKDAVVRDKSADKFGGIVVLCVGDFLQIPPNNGSSVIANSADARSLWHNIRRLKLTEVMRSRGCAVQTDRANDIREQAAVRQSHVSGIKIFDATDPVVAADDGWLIPTSIHHLNESKNAAGLVAIKRHAKLLGKVIYKFRMSCAMLDRAKTPAALREVLYSKFEARLCQFFFVGMRVMLLENMCIALGLTNGTVGVVKSILSDCAFVRDNDADGDLTRLYAGPPRYILVAFALPKEPAVQSEISRRGMGWIEGMDWVVPIAKKTLEAVEIAHKTTLNPTGFPLSQAYALTIHKSQGMTIKNLLIDMGKRSGSRVNMTFEIFYVAVSRAPSDNMIRILPIPEGREPTLIIGKKPSELTIAYLTKNWRSHENNSFYTRRWDNDREYRRLQQEDGRSSGRGGRRVETNNVVDTNDNDADIASPEPGSPASPRGRGRGGSGRGGSAASFSPPAADPTSPSPVAPPPPPTSRGARGGAGRGGARGRAAAAAPPAAGRARGRGRGLGGLAAPAPLGPVVVAPPPPPAPAVPSSRGGRGGGRGRGSAATVSYTPNFQIAQAAAAEAAAAMQALRNVPLQYDSD